MNTCKGTLTLPAERCPITVTLCCINLQVIQLFWSLVYLVILVYAYMCEHVCAAVCVHVCTCIEQSCWAGCCSWGTNNLSPLRQCLSVVQHLPSPLSWLASKPKRSTSQALGLKENATNLVWVLRRELRFSCLRGKHAKTDGIVLPPFSGEIPRRYFNVLFTFPNV